MTPEQQALRDMWMSECWEPVPEWHASKDERADAAARNEALADSSGDDDQQLRAV